MQKQLKLLFALGPSGFLRRRLQSLSDRNRDRHQPESAANGQPGHIIGTGKDGVTCRITRDGTAWVRKTYSTHGRQFAGRAQAAQGALPHVDGILPVEFSEASN